MARRRKKMHRVWGDEGAHCTEAGPADGGGPGGSRRGGDGYHDPGDGDHIGREADSLYGEGRKVYFDEWT